MAVHTELIERVTVVTLSRPEVRNAVDAETASALAEAFLAFDENDDSDVAILYGADGNFCAGADLKALAAGSGSNELSKTGNGPMGPSRLVLGKPVIAAVAGHAVAGGLELALWCDLRVAEASAVFGVYCRRWGVPLVDGGTVRLPRLIGHSRAMDMILTGREVGAAEAQEIGLANRVVADGTVLQEALALAGQLVRFPQHCLRSDRLSALHQWGLSEADAIDNEFARGLEVIESLETLTGATRFASGKGRHGKFDDI
ncbi:MAG: crotonase/enoyl-CoA hydratase family protein [Halieaceae bacterium]